VLDLQFDRKRMASMSADGRIRLWLWHNKNVLGANKKKYHILGPGETLRALSLRYRTSIDKLLEWNNLADSNKLYLGQKLVVQIDKSDGTTDDDLKESDTAVSVQFGKLLYENLEFASSNKAASQDVDTQWAAQKVTLLAKEYFPNMEEEDVTKNGDLEETYEEDSDSDGPYDSTVEEEEVDEEENENNGE
jgi:LysM repeat protein